MDARVGGVDRHAAASASVASTADGRVVVLDVRQRRMVGMGGQPVVDEALDDRLRRSVLRMKFRPRSDSK